MKLQIGILEAPSKYGSFVKIAVLALTLGVSAGFVAGVQSQGRLSPEAASATEAGFVYTANERANSISVIDLGAGKVTAVLIDISPHNVQASPGGKILVVGMPAGVHGHAPGAGQHGEVVAGRGRLLVLDSKVPGSEGLVDIEVGRAPAHVVVDGQGRFAFVTNAQDNNVSVVEVKEARVVGTIATGASPHGLRISPDGSEVYVANTGDNSVSVIDVAARREVTRVPVGKAPAQVGFTPDGRRVYVSSTVENSVTVIDTAQRKAISTVNVGRKPIQVYATPDGRFVYVANEGTSENPDNRTSVIDATTNQVVATVETGKGAHGVVVSDDGSRAFIANAVDNTVSVIDTATQKVIRTFKVGEGSGGITFRSVDG